MVQIGSMEEHDASVNDRISALPKEVLSHILSFLPTIYAVRTTVLSKRWNKLWTCLPTLLFDGVGRTDLIAFARFVDRVLYYRDSVDIQKFRLILSFDDFELPRVDGWICTAIKRNAVDLFLNVESDPDKPFELPNSLFLSKTLQVLTLASKFIVNPPTSKCFPSLKFLYVLVHRPSEGSLEKLLSHFPVLEELTVQGVLDEYDDEDLDINVSAPELRKLVISLEIENQYNDFKFCITAPKLEFLGLSLDNLSNCSFSIHENSLVKANVDFQFAERPDDESDPEEDASNVDQYAEQPNRAIAILESISNIKYLSLSACNLEGDLPDFHNLNRLKVVFYDCCYWGFLTKLLEKSRNLEYLAYEHQDCMACNEKGFEHDEFNPPELVPVGLSTRLKIITVNRFTGRQDEMEAVKYMLGNAKVLNKMTATMRTTGLSFAYMKAVYEELILFQRLSKTCQVEML